MEVAQEAAGSGFVPFTPVLSHLGQLLPLSPVLGDEGPCSDSCKVLLAKGRAVSEGGNEWSQRMFRIIRAHCDL